LRRRQHYLNDQINEQISEQINEKIEDKTEVQTAASATKIIETEKNAVAPAIAVSQPPALAPMTAKPLEVNDKQTASASASTPVVTTSSPTTATEKPETTSIKKAQQSIISQALLQTGLDQKTILTPYEIRLKLALAYVEMGDSEGACLLLEDVIRDAPADQKHHAQRLLKSIEEKLA
jgi:FimV-like protein